MRDIFKIAASAFIMFLLVNVPRICIAQQQPPSQQQTMQSVPTFDLPTSGIQFITGDSWIIAGEKYKLFGVQSCLRGTQFTNATGNKLDCGEASIAYLAALIKDSSPTCTPILKLDDIVGLMCVAHISQNNLDLGTILIAQGFSFAAYGADNRPVYSPYEAAEIIAKKNKAGLWAAVDMPHPRAILQKAIAESGKK